MLEVRKAVPEEYETVAAFYDSVIDGMEGAEYHPAWEKGVYPAYETLKESIERGELFLGFLDGKLACATIMNDRQSDGSEGEPWKFVVPDEEIRIFHALTVHPDFAGKGLGKQFVTAGMNLAKEQGAKAMRLDVLKGNVPAERLYPACGFVFVSNKVMFYEDTGWTDFILYEWAIRPGEPPTGP